jgi:hypothetical protein
VTLQEEGNGEFSMIVQTDPSMVEMLNIFDWPECDQHDETYVPIPFTFGYGFTYQLGAAERTGDGGLVLRGELPLNTPPPPDCTTRTWWEIWIEPPAN